MNNLSIFHVEWMQPDWLPSRAQQWITAMLPIMVFGLVLGLVLGLLTVLSGLTPIKLRETGRGWLRSSWRKAGLSGILGGLFLGLGIGLGGGLVEAVSELVIDTAMKLGS